MITLNETKEQIRARYKKNFNSENFVFVSIPSRRKHWSKSCFPIFEEIEERFGIQILGRTDCYPDLHKKDFEEFEKIHGKINEKFFFTFDLVAHDEYELKICRQIIQDKELMKRIMK